MGMLTFHKRGLFSMMLDNVLNEHGILMYCWQNKILLIYDKTNYCDRTRNISIECDLPMLSREAKFLFQVKQVHIFI